MAAPSGARQKSKPYGISTSGSNLELVDESEPNIPFIALTPITGIYMNIYEYFMVV